MDVLFLSPAYPPEMQQFTRGLVDVGARVWGVGDTPLQALPPHVRRQLTGYLQVPAILDEDDVIRRVEAWLGGRRPDRVEGLWEVVTMLAARLRTRFGVPGMTPEVVHGFRDKVEMKRRAAAGGVRVPEAVEARSVDQVQAFARDHGFPLIVKPMAGAGSADTWRVDDEAALQEVLTRIQHLPAVDVEGFVSGPEFTYETLCIGGRPVYQSVSRYLPNTLVARQNEWISPIILCLRDPEQAPGAFADIVPAGLELGHRAMAALGMGTGFTHMEWFVPGPGEAVFGEIACRPPGANMVDLMNYAGDIDLYREWARAVVHGRVELPEARPYHAAIVFKRAQGQGRIRAIHGLRRFVARHGTHIARLDLLPIGARRRDWQQTFLSDGNLVVRHPDVARCQAMAEEAAATIQVYAG